MKLVISQYRDGSWYSDILEVETEKQAIAIHELRARLKDSLGITYKYKKGVTIDWDTLHLKSYKYKKGEVIRVGK